ncbi:MAG TPA: VCBS repeat-containing protein [Ignavibacteria bacterium]
MKKVIMLLSLVLMFNVVKSDIPSKIFSKEDIKKLAGAYLEGKLSFENPIFVDVDKDGDFDALKFNSGNVEYYKNTGTIENPVFILENKNYDKYDIAFFADPKMPYPIFFADMDGDKDLDLFVIRDKEYNRVEKKYNYNISTASNALDLDTGTLITIILVLVIVILVLAILGK